MKNLQLIKQAFPALWCATAIIILTAIITCVGYNFVEAFTIGVAFLPGILIARYAMPHISFTERFEGWHNTILLWAGILTVEYLLIMLANYYLLRPIDFEYNHIPSLLTNPLFILFVVATFAIVWLIVEREIEQRQPYDTTISFTSERRSITLNPAEILYFESNDTEVFVCTVDGDSFRTRTRISQWENILDKRFLRIHRSYIINAHRIDSFDGTRVRIQHRTIELSRKYKESVRERLKVE